MGEGNRDAFIEDDDSVIGNYDAGTNIMGYSASKLHRKKSRKNKQKVRVYRRRRRSRRRTKVIRSSKKVRSGKRKGMSREFLRNLRKKHGLGEFKRR